MTRRPTPWWIGHVLLAMSMSGCAKRSAPDHTAAPESQPDRRGGADLDGVDDIAGLEQQLAAREGQLRSAGIAVPDARQLAKKEALAGSEDAAGPATPTSPPQPTTAPVAAADAPTDMSPAKPEAQGGRCMQVCEISAAICSLQDQICGLLPRHPDDPRYQSACERATADCQISTEACYGCSDP